MKTKQHTDLIPDIGKKVEESWEEEKIREILSRQKITVMVNVTPNRSETTITQETAVDEILQLIKDRDARLIEKLSQEIVPMEFPEKVDERVIVARKAHNTAIKTVISLIKELDK